VARGSQGAVCRAESLLVAEGQTQVNTKMQTQDFSRYLGVLYFGSGKTFERYINRAYRDFNRTLHIQDKKVSRQDKVKDCTDYLLARLAEAKDGRVVCRSQEDFDVWHEKTCDDLIQSFGESDMFYGHAQKWVNMTLKYLFTMHGLGLEKIDTIADWYPFAHMPIDKVVLRALGKNDFSHPRPEVWSQLGKADYLALQHALRSTYVECPMDVEFMLWRGEGKPSLRAQS
jgi:hypothetical protein